MPDLSPAGGRLSSVPPAPDVPARLRHVAENVGTRIRGDRFPSVEVYVVGVDAAVLKDLLEEAAKALEDAGAPDGGDTLDIDWRVYRDGTLTHLRGLNPGITSTACGLDAGAMLAEVHPAENAAVWCTACMRTIVSPAPVPGHATPSEPGGEPGFSGDDSQARPVAIREDVSAPGSLGAAAGLHADAALVRDALEAWRPDDVDDDALAALSRLSAQHEEARQEVARLKEALARLADGEDFRATDADESLAFQLLQELRARREFARAAAAEEPGASTKTVDAPDGGARLAINPEPLAVVARRDEVTGLVAIRDWMRQRTREDRLRVWLALGGTEEDFPYRVDAGDCELWLDRQRHAGEQVRPTMTGAEIRALPFPGVRDTDDLYLEGEHGDEDRLVGHDESVAVGGRAFFTVPRVITAGCGSGAEA